MVDKSLYNTVLSQTFSTCGKYLVAGNTYGELAVYDLSELLNPTEDSPPSPRKPIYKHTLRDGVQLCSMVSYDKFLIIGTVGEIIGLDWKSVTASTNPKICWQINIPTSKDALEKPDVNSLIISDVDGHLYAGCGDNKIYVFDLEDGKLLRNFEGHDDYIHSIHMSGTTLASASEDGSVRLWDSRQEVCCSSVHPFMHERLCRPHLGKWVGAVALSDDWMICGGGPRPALWHTRSLDMTMTYPMDDAGIHFLGFHEDRIMAGGCHPFFYHFSYSGDILAQIPSSSTSVYSAILQETPIKALSIVGSSAKIDLCSNFSYRDQVLSF
ncbi:THO complex subunit 6 [Ischnura elegans]|uniref:THO complex subunit 6 n=1 Tax=Ischnura elegans TaxID=197161 RepID=UPI001ED8AED2|nr:THO complex subunit 6 [Ischnura elegans]